ncbi:MAG: glutamate synthase [Thermodesulfovibrionia bacterium]|nr:glutamate synthase [Thermodesulfovibrionia bacterium]MCK5511455.1 glutamate synthase [Thermodesulfovibrionia bacterium]
MCRLVALTSNEYFSPLENILALDTMKEGHDGSGLGLVLKNLGGEFEELKKYPILSAVCSHSGMSELNSYMNNQGFQLKHKWKPRIKKGNGMQRHDHYIANAYDYPETYRDRSLKEKEALMMNTRLALRDMGEGNGSIYVFSFYPDIITLKEVGDPLQVAEFFGLDRYHIKAKIIFAQGRQNTNYQIYLYACHPFFIQGYCSMTNGENTAFVPIKEYLMSRGNPGYMGYNSDSEVFTHILHYISRELGYPLHYYKDVITPLKDSEIQGRKDRDAIRLLKMSLRPLCIDGPNCVIGFTPDGTCFMAQDSKKLRPGVVGGVKGKYGFMSEECGLDRTIPERDKSKDIFPMKYDMVIVEPGAQEVKVWNQLKG